MSRILSLRLIHAMHALTSKFHFIFLLEARTMNKNFETRSKSKTE